MKTIPFILLAIFIAFPAFAGGVDLDIAEEKKFIQFSYQSLETCNIKYHAELSKEGIVATSDMQNANYNVLECYTSIAHSIIDRYYSNNAQAMKENWEKMQSLSFDLASDIYANHDYCPCGTMMVISYTGHVVSTMEAWLKSLIKHTEIIVRPFDTTP